MKVAKKTGVISINIKITDEERNFINELNDLIGEVAISREIDWNEAAEEIMDVLSECNEYEVNVKEY